LPEHVRVKYVENTCRDVMYAAGVSKTAFTPFGTPETCNRTVPLKP
jgi:hypothetical protein